MQRRRRRSGNWLVRAAATGAVAAGMVAGAALTSGPATAVPLPAAGTIATVMGLGRYNGDGIPATSAALYLPFGQLTTDIAGPAPGGLAVAGDGTLYIGDRLNHRVRKVSPDGEITTVAGTGTAGFGGDGAAATRAALNQPAGVAVAPDGSLFVADAANRRVRKVAPDGTITTVAGGGGQTTGVPPDRGSGNGCPATAGFLREPTHLALDSRGNLYITDRTANQVRKLDPNGCLSTFAGRGAGGGNSGQGEQAQFANLDGPVGVAVGRRGEVYIADRNNHRIKVVEPSGIIFDLAGTGRTGDGTARTDTRYGEFDPSFTEDVIENCSGTALPPVPACAEDERDAPGARFDRPNGLAVGDDGSVYVADLNDHVVRRIMSREVTHEVFDIGDEDEQLPKLRDHLDRPVARVATVAGVRRAIGSYRFNAGPTDEPRFKDVVSPVEFFPGSVYSEDGSALAAQLRWPTAVAFGGPDQALYILDQGNNRVLKVDDNGPGGGKVERVAGPYVGASGAPLSTQLMRPRGVAWGPDGSLFVADADNSVVRKITPDGAFADVVAGTLRRGGPNDAAEGKLATQVPLSMPTGVAVGPDGSLYIADRGMHRVFKITNPGPKGVLTVVAGTGRAASQANLGFSPEGRPATQETLNAPGGVAVGADGTVYISDTHNSKIRKVTPDGRLFSIAGTGAFSWSGDNADARAADLNQPLGIAVGPDNTVYFVDVLNVCARKITPGGALVTVAGLCGRATGPAGAGFPLGDGGAATEASLGASAAVVPAFGGPDDLALGPDGSLYIADTYNSRIRRVAPDGQIGTVVGTGDIGDAGDGGRATAALLAGPRGVAADPTGNLAIADTENNKIRVVAVDRQPTRTGGVPGAATP